MKKSTWYDGVVFLKSLSWLKVYNAIVLKLSYSISHFSYKPIVWGKPTSLSIEPTNLCNLKCPECPSGINSFTRPRVFLSEEDFRKTIKQVKDHLIHLQLFFQGEPFMHPKIYDFIKIAKANSIYTSTSTNGQFLSKDNCKKIIDSGLSRLIVSIDGTTQESFEKYRVGGSLDLAKQGIKNLQKLKKELNSHTPKIIIQFVVFSTNEHQIKDIKQLAKELKVDDLRLKSAQILDLKKDNHLLPENNKYRRYNKQSDGTYKLKRKANFKCWRMYHNPVLSADNKLLPCCFDKDAQYAYGSLKQDEFSKLWKGPDANNLRLRVWQQKNEPSICDNCSEGLAKTWFRQ